MNVKVNNNACIGCGACAAICPDVFEITDEGYAKAKVEVVTEDKKEEVVEAKEGCPTSAIEAE